ncbi:MAG TPA: hypothetical protein VLL52_07360 [Anaerolineae bacterium]|nr:hypothetical protein [Anaerolineae bacterium]
MAQITDNNNNQYNISDELLSQYNISTDVPKNFTINGAQVWGSAKPKDNSSESFWLTVATGQSALGDSEYLWVSSTENQK